jgi:PRC-barrel domain
VTETATTVEGRSGVANIDPQTLDRWRALVVVDRDGSSVGTISEFYLDRGSGQPTWALINSGLLDTTQTFVPLTEAVESAGALRVPYSKWQVRTAPGIDPDGELTADEEAVLFAHYGIEYRAASEPPAEVDEGQGEERTGVVAPRRLIRHSAGSPSQDR